MSQHHLHHVLMSQPQLHRAVSDNITVRKMVTRFATSPPTDNCPQPQEALLNCLSTLTLPFKWFDSSAL
jgi:hypothetical protein